MSAGVGEAGHPGGPAAPEPAAEAARGWTAPMRVAQWATVALLLGAYVAVWATGAAATAAEAAWLAVLHRSFCVATLALTLVRLAWRQRTEAPPPADLPMVRRLAARANAAALYGSLVSQPLLGLAASVLHGDRVSVFGVVLPVARPLARAIFQIYGWLSLLMLAVIGVRAVAVLFHHVVCRDGELSRTVPRTGRASRPSRPGARAMAESGLR